MHDIVERQRLFQAAHGWVWRNLPLDQQIDRLQYLVMALSGELGEIANPIKKFVRTSERQGIDLAAYDTMRTALHEEVADVFIYLLILCDVLDIDLEKAYYDKVAVNEKKHAGFSTTTQHYGKLVRDNIPDIIKAEGRVAQTRIASEDEYKQALLRKLREETTEFSRNPSVEELADVFEVVRCLATTHGIDMASLENARHTKELQRGSFSRRIILEKTE